MSEEEYTLDTLPCGSIFRTQDGIYAVKSEYHYSNEHGAQWLCVLTASGEFAHFPDKNQTKVERCSVARFSGWRMTRLSVAD